MNEPTHNDQLKADQHVLDLLNGSIDGELSTAEQAELDGLLAGSARVRDLNRELGTLTDTLDGVPEKQPPEYLHNAIINQVRLPVAADIKPMAGGPVDANRTSTGSGRVDDRWYLSDRFREPVT